MPKVLGRYRRRRAAGAGILVVALASIGLSVPAAGMPKVFLGSPLGAVLTYSTYLGGDNLIDNVNDVVTDRDGNVYVTGSTETPEAFPTTAGAYQTEASGRSEAFVAKFDPAGGLVYSTLFGGTGAEEGKSLDVTPTGEVVMAGTTLSPDLPTTPGALQNEFKGVIENCDFNCVGDAFVVSFNADGSDIGFSTYLGGDLGEVASALQLDAAGNAYLAGFTSSPNFPVTQNAYDTVYDEPTCFDMCEMDVFVAQLNPAGSQLRFATFFGGTSWDSVEGMAIDEAGNIYVAGATRSVDLDTTAGSFQPDKNGNGDFDFSAFVASFNPDASELRYATYLGGKPEEQATAITVGPDGTAWVAGWAHGRMPTTDDALQPTRGGEGDGFVSALTPDGSDVSYGTFFGGSRFDSVRGIELADDTVTIFGGSASSDLITRRAFQAANRGMDDLFLTRFVPGAARPRFSTYIGGERFETGSATTMHDGSIYLVGGTESKGLPLAGRFFSADRGGNDGFLMRVDNGASARIAVRAETFSVARIRGAVTEASLYWHNATSKAHRVAENETGMFDSGTLRKGSDYHFTFPSGRFVVTDVTTGATHRVSVTPIVFYGEQPGTIQLWWARLPLGDGFAFDVQIKREDAAYESLFEATTDLEALLNEPEGNYRFRARVRNLETGDVSGWSPPAMLSAAS